MLKKLTMLLSGVVLALALPAAAEAGKTYYWISHGSPADPVWTYFLAGAKQWATDTGNTVNTSFHNGQVAPGTSTGIQTKSPFFTRPLWTRYCAQWRPKTTLSPPT